MAKQTTVTLIDDLDGGKAEETIRFGLEGNQYEIDLSKKNAAALRKALAPYKDAARPARDAAPKRAYRARGTAAPASRKTELAAVREWAEANGIVVAARGRIAANVIEQFEAARG
ncbi:Lsr2 family protein [Nakamurella silvestris]|nr:Lsr2 family protein [Nakamurella silvestris]